MSRRGDPFRTPERPAEPRRPRTGPDRPSPLPSDRARKRVLGALERDQQLASRVRWVRIAGLAAIAVGVALGALTANDLALGIRSHPRAVLELSAAAILAGAWFAIVGLGGDAEDPPRWVWIGGAVAGTIGVVLGVTVYLDLLAALVGY